MDWTISHFWLHFHTKNKVVDSDAEAMRCDIRGLPHPRSFLVFQPSALKKVHFYCLLESADSTNQPPVRPYRGIPFPFLSDVGVGLADKFAQSGDHLAAPVGKFCDLCVDTFRWVHSFLLGPCLRF